MKESDIGVEMENYQPKESIIQDNKPYNLTSTSNEIQNIFKKIRKKNKVTEIKKGSNDFEDDESKDISNFLDNNEKNKKSPKDNIDIKSTITIIVNIISFIFFYFSFTPVTDYFFPISFFIFPMDLFSLILCGISSLVTSVVISLIIIQKLSGYHLLYMLIYYICVFFLHHFKYIGTSHFDQSLSVYYIFISILIHSLCLFFICYFTLKKNYYEGHIKKDNIFIKSLVSRWHSSEKIKRSENESILINDKNKSFIFSDKKKNTIKFYLIIFSLVGIMVMHTILLRYKKKQIFTCDNWDVGINGTKILNNNEQYKCQIQKPSGYCYMDYFKGYFDLTPQYNRNCSIRDPILEKRFFLKNLENNNEKVDLFSTNVFAFPLTNIDKKYFLKNQKSVNDFGRLVNKDIYDYEEKSNANKEPKPEAILDFSKNNVYNGRFGELKINLNYNQTLSQKRKQLENDNSLFNNIFMIYVDATSRAHFQRSFPKLSNFIKNFMTYDENLPEKKIEAYQFMKYQSFAPSTPQNILPMFYGNSMKSNKGIHSIKYFKQNGFVTGHEVDMCNKEQYDISHDSQSNIDNREYEEWDHENIAYLCDGNYFENDNPYPGNRGAFSIKERCLYGYPVSHYMINYAKEFWVKYQNNKKYFRMAFNYGHEKTGAVISNLDEPLYDFIFEFYDKGYFDNTALFIVSDHGNQNNGIYNIISSTEFGLEKKMGTFFLILSNNKKKSNYEQNLLKNQQIFLTPYDIHDTMIHIIYGDSNINDKYAVNNKGKSVLLSINPSERNCKKYDDWIEKDFCCCLDNN